MYLVGFPQMQQSCSLSEIITSAFISILSSLNNSFQASLQNSLIKYKILSFSGTFASNSGNIIYDYSNDEDLKDAEIISISPLHIGLYSAITWYNFDVNLTTKKIHLLVGTGQRIDGTYSILYK